MSKTYNYKTFTFKTLNYGELEITCHVYEYSRGWGHKCSYTLNGIYQGEKRKTYYNRTWERFEFESLIYTVINDLFSTKKEKFEKDFIIKQVDAIAKNESEKALAWFENIKTMYDGLNEETKKELAKKDVFANTQEEAEAIIKNAKMLEVLKA